jgi:hypothetical protein
MEDKELLSSYDVQFKVSDKCNIDQVSLCVLCVKHGRYLHSLPLPVSTLVI